MSGSNLDDGGDSPVILNSLVMTSRQRFGVDGRQIEGPWTYGLAPFMCEDIKEPSEKQQGNSQFSKNFLAAFFRISSNVLKLSVVS